MQAMRNAMPNDENLRHVLVLVAGGTIGIVGDEKDNRHRRVFKLADKADFEENILGGRNTFSVPVREGGLRRNTYVHVDFFDLRTGHSDLDAEDSQRVEIHDSAQVDSRLWVLIAKKIVETIKDEKGYNGFVILHGLDTLAYTASGVSFLLGQKMDLPIIFTGSQRPLNFFRTDAVQNVRTAITLAAGTVIHDETSSVVREVAIYSFDRLLRATRVCMRSASSYLTYESPNYGHLAEIGDHIIIHGHLLKKRGKAKFTPEIPAMLQAKVAIIDIYPGMNPDMLENVCDASKGKPLDGIILRAYGMGTAPTSKRILESIRTIIASGTVIMNITQARSGRISYGIDPVSLRLFEAGVIPGSDMTAEAALAKMIYVLSMAKKKEREILLQKNLCGEQSQSIHIYDFGPGNLTEMAGHKFISQIKPLKSTNSVDMKSISYIQFRVLGLLPPCESTYSVVVKLSAKLFDPQAEEKKRNLCSLVENDILEWHLNPEGGTTTVNLAYDITADAFDKLPDNNLLLRIEATSSLSWHNISILMFSGNQST